MLKAYIRTDFADSSLANPRASEAYNRQQAADLGLFSVNNVGV